MKKQAEEIAGALGAARKALALLEREERELRAIDQRIATSVAEGLLGRRQAEKLSTKVRARADVAVAQAEAAITRARTVAAEGRSVTSRERFMRDARFVPAAEMPSDYSSSEVRLIHAMTELLEEQRRTRVTADLSRATPTELVALARDAAARQDVALTREIRTEHERRWQGLRYDNGRIGGGADQAAVGAAITSAEQSIVLPDVLVKARVDVSELEHATERLEMVTMALRYGDAPAQAIVDDAALGDAITSSESSAEAVGKIAAARKAAGANANKAVNEASVEAFKKMLEEEDPEEGVARDPSHPDAVGGV